MPEFDTRLICYSCFCGGKYNERNRKRHNKTKKHREAEKRNEQQRKEEEEKKAKATPDPLALSSYCGLNVKICVYMPSKDRNGAPLPKKLIKKCFNYIKKALSLYYGGYTIEGGSVGGWLDIDKSLFIEEDITKIYSFTTAEQWEETQQKMMYDIKYMCYKLNQSCVSLEHNNTLYFISNKAEEEQQTDDESE